MRKILYIVIAMMALLTLSQVFAATQSCATAQQTQSHQKPKRSIMELPLVERAILIIKRFETLHDLRHLPYCGYGHRIWPGEKLPRHRALTEREADALLRKDFAKLCAMYSHLGKDSVLAAALAYNIGPGAVNRSSFYQKLKRGDRNIFKEYTSHCHYNGKFHKQLHQRRIMEISVLFTK